MKKTRRTKPTANKLSILHQLCNYIPGHLVVNLARKHGVDKKARSFTPWSHVVSMLYAQLTHSIGLNDVCDALWAITEERCRAFEGQRLPAAVDFPMPINIVMRR